LVLNKVILTGATGMFGHHMYAALQSVGSKVVPVSSFGTTTSVNWDLTKWLSNKELDDKFGNPSAIIHGAAIIKNETSEEQKDKIYDVNVRSCINIAEWALYKSIPLVFISSSSVYLNPHDNLIKSHSTRGANQIGGFYGVTKILAEDILDFYRSRGLKVSILRPSSLYGYGMRNKNIIKKFMDLAQKGSNLCIYEPINDSIDFLHASDLSSAVLSVLETECWETLNVSFGKLVTIKELAETCVKIVGSGNVQILSRDKQNDTQVPTQTFALDNYLAQCRLGWTPKINIKRGLELLYLKSTEYPIELSKKIGI
jgi:UDP-glucose 4-epimerase